MSCNAIFSFIVAPLFFLQIIFSFGALAQGVSYDAFFLQIDKEYPSPGETVQLNLRSNKAFTSNIRSVDWYINGEEKTEFTNLLEINEISSATPKQVTANVIFFNVNGERRAAQIFTWIRPVIFDILWEGESAATPLYRGHSLAGPETPINISAKIQYIDPSGTVYDENDFSFVWEIESEYYGAGGPGKSNVVYSEGGNNFNNFVFVKARVTLINSTNIFFEKSIYIPISQPRVLLYSKTLLYGLFSDTAVPREFSISGDSTTLSAYPYFFNKFDFENNNIQYNWFVNNNPSPQKSGVNQRDIDISVEGENISVPLRILVENENRDSQQAENTLSITL